MTRKGPSKSADKTFADGRLKVARAFMKAAQTEAALAEEADIANPIVSQTVQAAIAYTDALTASVAGQVNQQDHAGAVKALRSALGKRLPGEQERRLARILGEKDAAQYSARPKRISEARRLLADLESYAAWAELELARTR
ncbi:hypothetical protein [Dongia deserti]|uniref:hypothetical protein n=1 Tax=Dongia deserti TaxID=2268030 RepID=UPI000E6547D5|nr:hypothetical protein [Dongia deserti]